jgi:WD40 repeat protein
MDAVLIESAQGLQEVSIVTGKAIRHHAFPPGVTSLLHLQGAIAVGVSRDRLVAFKWAKPGSEKVLADAVFRSLAIAPDEKLLACVAHDGGVQLFDPGTGVLVRRLPRRPDAVNEVAACFSPDSNSLALISSGQSAPVGGETVVWDLRANKHWAAPTSQGSAVAFSPDSRLLAVGGHPIGLFDATSGARLNGGLDAAHARGAAFAADGAILLTVQEDGAGLYEFPSGKPLRHFPHPGLSRAKLSPDGRHLATTMLHHDLRIWDTRSGREMRLPDQGVREGAGRHLAFTSDSKHLLSWETDFRLLKWNVSNGRLVAEHQPRPAGFTPIDEDDEDGRRQLRRRRDRLVILRGRHGFSRDGTRLLWQFDDAYIYDTATGAEQRKFSMSFNVGAGEATADRDFERLFVTVGDRIALIQLNNGRIFGEFDGGRRDVVTLEAAISADGRLAAACLAEPAAEIRVWETATLGRRLTIPIEHGHVRRLDFSEDGRFLAGVHSDGTVLVWDLRAAGGL